MSHLACREVHRSMARRMTFSLLRSFNGLKPSPLLPLPLPLPVPTRVATPPYRAISSATNLRLLPRDCAENPLHFGAFARAAFLLLQRRGAKRECAVSPEAVQARRVDERGGGLAEGEEKARAIKKGNSNNHSDKKTVKIMTYNVWFREGIELIRRMNGIGDLIQHHSPDLICFQEVTPNIYLLLKKSDWWQTYKCSLPHKMAMQRRYYSMQLVVATSHFESPIAWDLTYSKERVEQANETVRTLGAFRNVIFCGDTNWDEKGDGPFPLPAGWIDAWDELKPGENGWTYDTKANAMLSGNTNKVQKRLDRFVCKLSDFKVDSIEMIGEEAIPGVTYIKDKKFRRVKQKIPYTETRQLVLPVLPTDHLGLVLTISSV